MKEGGLFRLDVIMVSRGLASGRDAAKRRILAGEVRVNGKTADKPSVLVTGDDAVTLEGEGLRYVGRGGLKLERALETGRFDLRGVTALDVGASTGGFTDCLLRHGAAKVYAVDVGHGQLHPRLAADSRVVSLEGTDIRRSGGALEAVPAASLDFCTVDVSFVSLCLVFPAARRFLRSGAGAVCLIKPQFEAGRAAVGKNGVVKNIRDHVRVLSDMLSFFSRQDCRVLDLMPSPVTGGDGNLEYLVLLETGAAGPAAIDPAAVAEQAFRDLR